MLPGRIDLRCREAAVVEICDIRDNRVALQVSGRGRFGEEYLIPVDGQAGGDSQLAAAGRELQVDRDSFGLPGGHSHIGVHAVPLSGGILHLEFREGGASLSFLGGSAEGAAIRPVDPAIEEKCCMAIRCRSLEIQFQSMLFRDAIRSPPESCGVALIVMHQQGEDIVVTHGC